MADNNRNRRESSWRQQSGDWNDDFGRQQRNYTEEEPNYTVSENRGYQDRGNYSSGDGGWQSRYERQMNTGREGDFDNQRRFSRQGDDWSSQRSQSSGYSDFGGDYGSRDSGSRSSRNLYDRGYQGMGRRDFENRENRIGGSNYDRYGDYGRYGQGQSGYSNSSFGYPDYRSGGRDFERPGHGGWGNSRFRDYGRGDSEERSWWDRTTDEVSSWFGDEDAERRRNRDREMQGSYRGKGPKNYSRSDERIKEDINDKLSDDPFVDASDIDVSVNNGEVTLTGTVNHRNTKRRAEDIADGISGVRNVENRLRVSQMSENYSSSLPGANTTASTSSNAVSTEKSRRETSSTNR